MPSKPNTKIKRDTHGLFVQTDGNIYRPLLSGAYDEGIPQPGAVSAYSAYRLDPTLFAEGECVYAHHVSQTNYAAVRHTDGRSVHWFSHGLIYGSRTSDNCYRPYVPGTRSAPLAPQKRYVFVYTLPNGDPGNDYASGPTLVDALQNFYDRNSKGFEILSITKVS